MAYNDLRGAQYDLDITASAGINQLFTAEDENGNAYNLTGKSIVCVIRDDEPQNRDYGGQYNYDTTYSQTVTNAGAGQFRFYVPPSEFQNKQGGRLSYEVYMDDGAFRTGLFWGYLEVQERG